MNSSTQDTGNKSESFEFLTHTHTSMSNRGGIRQRSTETEQLKMNALSFESLCTEINYSNMH